MSFERFCVVFDDPLAAYLPGQTVSGKIEFCSNKPKKSTGVYVFANGEAKVHWTEKGKATEIVSEKTKKTEKVLNYEASEGYLQYRTNVAPNPGGVKFEISAGRHEYPFSFCLPEKLPSSFEGQFGYVRYIVTAIIERPGKKAKYESKKAFNVKSVSDLNAIEGASKEVKGSDQQMSGYWMFKTGPVMAKAWIDRAGYVPGEKILFSAEIENGSGRDISSSKVTFVENATFHSTLMSKTSTRELYQLKRGSSGSREVWTNVPIVVPPVVPSDFPHCKIIDINYQLMLSVKFGHLSSKLSIPLNIIIGTVPLRHPTAAASTTILGVPVGLPSVPGLALRPPPPIPVAAPDIAPPSYMECVTSEEMAAGTDPETSELVVFESKDQAMFFL